MYLNHIKFLMDLENLDLCHKFSKVKGNSNLFSIHLVLKRILLINHYFGTIGREFYTGRFKSGTARF